MSEGHTAARRYPVAMVWAEVDIAKRRINHQHITQSVLMQACIGSVINGKNGGKQYQKLIKELQRG